MLKDVAARERMKRYYRLQPEVRIGSLNAAYRLACMTGGCIGVRYQQTDIDNDENQSRYGGYVWDTGFFTIQYRYPVD